MKTARFPRCIVLLCALSLASCSREQPAAPGLHTISGRVEITGAMVDSTSAYLGKRTVTDADGIAVELLFGSNVVARVLTAGGVYRFTGLAPGGYVARARVIDGFEDVTATLTIADGDVAARDTLRLSSVGDLYPVPNPMGASTTLYFNVPVAEHVEVRIYDLAGAPVRTLHTGTLLPGLKSATWTGIDIAGKPVTQPYYWATLVAGADVRTQLLFR